jgi:hypothetical protein
MTLCFVLGTDTYHVIPPAYACSYVCTLHLSVPLPCLVLLRHNVLPCPADLMCGMGMMSLLVLPKHMS